MIVFSGVSKAFRIRNARSLKQTVMNLIRRNTHIDEFTAVNNISFAVNPGEAVAVMGRNGSGKSTTLKLLSGVLRPTAGWIRVRGRIAGLLEVGAGFHPDLTGRENVYLNAAILGMSKAETDAQLESIIEFSEIGDFIDTEVKKYSSGMYARLGFAVAIHTELDVLLVDEVLSVGDADFRAKCNAKLKELQEQGKTMFIVSHSAGQVKKLCRRGIVLDKGRKIYDGPIDGALKLVAPKRAIASATMSRERAAKLASEARPPTKKPIISAVPVIYGQNTPGSLLSVDTGTWSPTPLSFVFQWHRDGIPIPGEAGSTYRITQEDIGQEIYLRLRGSKNGYQPAVKRSQSITVVADFPTQPQIGAKFAPSTSHACE